MHPPRTTSPLAAALAGLALLPAAPATLADRFEDAVRYTVKVRTAIPVPFIYDDGRGGTGAGFVIDRGRGWILTNAHVAGHGPSDVEVSFHDHGFIDAEVRYVDPHLDLALVTVPADAVPDEARNVSYDCERTPRTGEDVIAFGHPWELDYTATRGIVSGISTRWDRQWIQTDAPLNGGNSGGPLISLETGEVVGINTASIPGENVQNLNFAVPMQQACPVLALLRDGIDPTPASLPFTVAVREHGGGGLVIARVPAGAGHDLRPGDRILAVGASTQPPANQTELYRQLRGVQGDVEITVDRAGETVTRRIAVTPVQPVLEHRGLMVAGVLFAPVSPDLTRTEGDERLMVHSVEPGTPGHVSGLGRFHLVEAVNGEAIGTIEQLHEIVRNTGADEELRIIHRELTGGATWWTYNERLLPSRPYRLITRKPRESAP